MQGAWFFAIVSILLTAIVWFALQKNPMLAICCSDRLDGIFLLFMASGNTREEQERRLLKGGMSDISKIAYLEVLDATFSIDGVIGSICFYFFNSLDYFGKRSWSAIDSSKTDGKQHRKNQAV